MSGGAGGNARSLEMEINDRYREADRLKNSHYMQAEMDAWHAGMDARPAEMNGRQAEMDPRYAEMDARHADIMDPRHPEMNGRQAEMNGRHAEMNGRQANILKNARYSKAEMDAMQAEIQAELEALEARFPLFDLSRGVVEVTARGDEHNPKPLLRGGKRKYRKRSRKFRARKNRRTRHRH